MRLEQQGLASGREHPRVPMARVLSEFPGQMGNMMTRHARSPGRLASGGAEGGGQTCSNLQADVVTAAWKDLP